MEGFALERWIFVFIVIVPIVILFALNVHQTADAQPVPPD